MRRTPGSLQKRDGAAVRCGMPVSFDCTLSSRIFDIPIDIRKLYGSVEPIAGKIRGVSLGLFQVSSPVCVLAGQDLELLSQARVIQARVVECQKCAAGSYNLQMKLSFDACRRAEPRLTTDLPARLQVLGDSAVVSARVMNLSHAGLGLQLSKAIPVGTIISVDLGYARATGEVRHCTQHIENYRAGIHVHRFTSNEWASSPVFAAAGSASVSRVALEAFLRLLQERQLRYEAILVSLAFRSKTVLPAA